MSFYGCWQKDQDSRVKEKRLITPDKSSGQVFMFSQAPWPPSPRWPCTGNGLHSRRGTWTGDALLSEAALLFVWGDCSSSLKVARCKQFEEQSCSNVWVRSTQGLASWRSLQYVQDSQGPRWTASPYSCPKQLPTHGIPGSALQRFCVSRCPATARGLPP